MEVFHFTLCAVRNTNQVDVDTKMFSVMGSMTSGTRQILCSESLFVSLHHPKAPAPTTPPPKKKIKGKVKTFKDRAS